MKAIFKMDIDCGRQGELEGVFVTQKKYVDVLVEKKIEVYFGEVLGKHSDVVTSVECKEIKMVSDDPSHVELIEKLNLKSGHDPFSYPCVDHQAQEYELEGYDNTVLDLVQHIISKKSRTLEIE